MTRDRSSLGRDGGTAVDRLVAALFEVGELAPAAALVEEVRGWLQRSSRFRAFAEAHRDKIRKKLRRAADEDACRDVRAELLAAHLLIADRRFEIAFEAYGTGKRGPDLTVTFRANQRFNVEVTRLRGAGNAAEDSEFVEPVDTSAAAPPAAGSPAHGERGPTSGPSGPARLPYVLLGKLRQLPPGAPNVVLMIGDGVLTGESEMEAAQRLLKARADRRDDAFFARRGLESARGFYAYWLRLSGVFSRSEVDGHVSTASWPNREARHPLPRETATALLRCLDAT